MQKDIIVQNIKILNNKDISVIHNEDEDYIFGSLTSDGGGVFKKGIAIGIQDKMVSGLMIYDSENFYGYSDKYGLCLLSPHPDYNELMIPESIFFEKEARNTIQPSQTNSSESFKNLKETEKVDAYDKRLNIDIMIKDTNNFFIVIPAAYNDNKFKLSFDINFIYDLNSIISSVSLAFINESNRKANFKIMNDICYFEQNFSNDIGEQSINKISVEIINSSYFMISNKIFKK